MVRYIKSTGIKIEDQDHTAKLSEYLNGDPIPELLKDAEAKGLKVVYTYDMPQQGKEFRDADAITINNVTRDNHGTWYAIGISIQALAEGKEYTILVFLHEVAHLITDCEENHTIKFHQYLDYLLYEYNKVNGTRIENDYYGLLSQEATAGHQRREDALPL